jgi:hypothetical protein
VSSRGAFDMVGNLDEPSDSVSYVGFRCAR